MHVSNNSTAERRGGGGLRYLFAIVAAVAALVVVVSATIAWGSTAYAADLGGAKAGPSIAAKPTDLEPGRPAFLGVSDTASAPGSWTGLYIGLGGGYQVGDVGVSAVDGGETFAGTDGISASGWAGDARIGFDWQPSGQPFVLGVLAGYNVGEAEHRTHLGPLSVTAAIEPTWYVGGRAGLTLAGGKALAYVGYAYQEAEASGAIFCGDHELASGSTRVNAHVLLAGLETVIAPQLTLGAEYSLAKYDDIRIGGGDEYLNVEPEVHAFKVRLNWRLGAK